jgi:DNA-binding transcriptional regulator YdaS (Cro superfamily)
MLQIKRNVARVEGSATKFKDRNVDDATDGYVACESYKDTHVWEHVAEMERAMQVIRA